MSSYKHALAGYDEAFRQRLAETILNAIATNSIVDDAPVMCVRTRETLDALADILVAIMSMVPRYDTASELRKATEALAKRVRREVAQARAEGVPLRTLKADEAATIEATRRLVEAAKKL